MVISQLTAANQADTTMSVAGAEAAASAINARGGVNGSPIRIDSCDDKFDANVAAACARTAVSNGDVAVVGSISAMGDAVTPVLEDAGIAAVGSFPLSASDFSSPIAFPLAAGTPAAIAGAARQLQQLGAKTVSIAYTDVAAGAVAVQFVEAGLSGTDAQLGAKVPVPVGATDVAPLAAAAARDSDGVVIALQPEDTIKFVQAARQAGIDIPFSAPSIDVDLVEKLGDAARDLNVVSLYAPLTSDAKGIQEFKADMEQYQPDAVLSDWSVGAWLAVQTVARTIQTEGVTTVDKSTLLAALGKLRDLDMGGVIPPYSTEHGPGLPGLDRVFNPTVQFAKVEDGVVVATDGEFVNPFVPAGG